MPPSRPQRLKMGIVGLGRLWEARHKLALQRLADRFRVVAVYDQVLRRAEIEADSIGATAAESLNQIIERDDIEVISILTPQWFGLHAIELACRAGKAIYCGIPLATEPEQAVALAPLIRSSSIVFMPELARRFYPATIRLKELLTTTLGPARLVLGHTRLDGFNRYGQPGPTTQLAPAPLMVDPGTNLVDWCRYIFNDEPLSVQAAGTVIVPRPETTDANHDFEGFVVEFSDHRMAQINITRVESLMTSDATRFLPLPGFQVFAERGVAWVEMPDRIQWTDKSGTYSERISRDESVGDVLNLALHGSVTGEPSSNAPTWSDAYRLCTLVQDLRRSSREGCKVDSRRDP